MNKIDIYDDSSLILERKNPKCVISWITILILLTISLMIIFSIKFNIYKSYNAYVVIEDKTYLVILLNESDFPIDKSDKLYIKRILYDYKIVDISDNKMVIELSLSDDISINNNQVVVNILRNRTTIFEIINNKLREEFFK